MLDEKQMQDEAELWNEVNNPPEKTYDLFGQLVDLQIFKGAYRTGMRGAQPFDPALDKKAQTIIRFYIQPLPEINVTYTNQLTYESPNWGDWAKTTFPSIKALDIADAREINNRWFRFSRVSNGKTYTKSDGTQGEEKTWKIVAVFANEEACRAAYIAAGGASSGNGNSANGHNAPVATDNDPARATAYTFLKDVIVKNAAQGKATFAEVQEAVEKVLSQPGYAPVAKYFGANSPETLQLITDITGFLPF